MHSAFSYLLAFGLDGGEVVLYKWISEQPQTTSSWTKCVRLEQRSVWNFTVFCVSETNIQLFANCYVQRSIRDLIQSMHLVRSEAGQLLNYWRKQTQ